MKSYLKFNFSNGLLSATNDGEDNGSSIAVLTKSIEQASKEVMEEVMNEIQKREKRFN